MPANRRHGKARRSAAARRAVDRPERQQDARLVAARALSQDGVPFAQETWVVGVSPARLPDGRVLMWHPPQPVAFALIESKRARDRGVRVRRNLMAKLRARADGALSPDNPARAVDCLVDLHTAVLYAFTAIESLANHVIDMIEVPVVRRQQELSKDQMLWLTIDDKYKIVVPLIDGGVHVAGDAAIWSRFRKLKFLRDELVHVKRRGITSNPDDPTAYDRLMLGDADLCVEDAVAVIEGAWPGFLPEHVRTELGL